MNIHIATDHAGFELKEYLVSLLKEQGHHVTDHGAKAYEQTDDYPDFILPAAQAVVQDPQSKGIIIGGSGQGEAIAANKVKGIRAVVFYGGAPEIIRFSKEHNNANILSLGSRFLSLEDAQKAVFEWLSIEFTKEERHVRRIEKISSFEK